MTKYSYNEFHISRKIRESCDFPLQLYSSSGNVILANLRAVREFSMKFNEYLIKNNMTQISNGTLNAMGLLDEIFHLACFTYRRQKYPNAFSELLGDLEANFGSDRINKMLLEFVNEFPPTDVYQGKISAEDWLSLEFKERRTKRIRSNREQTLEEMIMLHLANENPALKPFKVLFDESGLAQNEVYTESWKLTQAYFKKLPYWGTFGHDLISFLREPINFAPDNLQEQLNYVRVHWADLFIPGGDGDEDEDYWLKRLFGGIDLLSEEWKPEWHPTNGGSPDMSPPNYDYLMREYERFSDDKEWMPRVVLMAKTVLVWLDQLTKKYGRPINRLDQIPDEELDALRDEGFTGLWLIGLWERSKGSRTIKQICGNPEAAASAYSLDDYEIAGNLGGWDALGNLRSRLWQRGIRLASDMVPNHTGMDAKWVVEKPDLFVQRRDNPFPQYTFNGVNLSHDSRVAIYLEDHYYSKNDCAVVFKRVDTQTGDTRYIYHGNDGTGMPWNDTAQIDFLNPQAREEVMQKILHVARNFPIIRFDAAMVLAKKHIKRLWYPEPGKGGDIATRSEYALTAQQFEEAIPNEFWREVVDRVAKEVPDTLLLAEAFWMMEGYFTRTLGMHRVYNSAFMNMLKKEENEKYRQTVKNTITFDPQILKRYVNFMNNPDEETAVAQFGKGDKYFGVCTLMSTMPGLPMFGHGQLEGFEEKYGMEYMKAYKDEKPDEYLMDRHRREIFPLLHKRYLFSGVEDFLFYDVWGDGYVNENVFAYSNRCGSEFSVVFYNNKYDRAAGWIKQSCPYAVKTGSGENDKEQRTRTIAEGLGLSYEDDYYVMFREQRSNLWFIRKCRTIHEQGMYIALNGFETQVLLDIHQEKDVDGKLATLCNFLNGRGTPNLEIAWQELHYKDLYDTFAKIFSSEFSRNIRTLTLTSKELRKEKIKRASAKAIFENVKENLLAFYEKAVVTVRNEYPIDYSSDKKKKASEKKLAALLKKIDTEKQLVRFKKELSAVCNEAKAVVKLNETIDVSDELALKNLNASIVNTQLSVIFTTVHVLAENGFTRRWSLQRKISEIVKDIDIAGDVIYNWFDRSFALCDGKQPKITADSMNKDSFVIAEKLVYSNDSWLLSGANDYNGTRWFNKELTDSTVNMYFAILKLTASAAKKEKLSEMLKKIVEAKEKAEYKAENFIKPFKPEEKAEKKVKTGKKTKKQAK